MLLQYLEAGPTATVTEKLEFLNRRWPLNEKKSSGAEFNPKYWINDPAKFGPNYSNDLLPGHQWFAGWEKVGEELGRQ